MAGEEDSNGFLEQTLEALRQKEELNERLDEQKDRYVQQAEVALREQEEKLSAGAGLLPPQPTDDDYEELGAALEGEAAPGSLPEEEPGRPHDSHAARYIGGAVVRQEQQGAGAADAAAAEPAAGLDEGVGAEAQLRYQKARLQVLEEELQKARGDAASTASKLQAAETQLKEAQQQRAKLERHEKSVAAALEREKLACAEQRQRAETFERELSLLRKEMDEAGRGQRNALGELRGKDVRLNRALEELEKYRTQLREMREARDGAGHDARADAQRLAAENARLRKRQSDLILAFKKQAKLIDVLKRQKLHVEAARMLSFTEEEFSKTLELGEQLAA